MILAVRRICTAESRSVRRCRAGSTRCIGTSPWAWSSRCTRSTRHRSGARTACRARGSAGPSSCRRSTTTPNHDDDRGTLVGFFSDQKADAMFELPADERRKHILASIARFLGPKAIEPVVYYESDWGSEEWTRGAYAASFVLGGLHRYGRDQRTPVGPIHFSCSDIAGAGYQHGDGAIRNRQTHRAGDRRRPGLISRRRDAPARRRRTGRGWRRGAHRDACAAATSRRAP